MVPIAGRERIHRPYSAAWAPDPGQREDRDPGRKTGQEGPGAQAVHQRVERRVDHGRESAAFGPRNCCNIELGCVAAHNEPQVTEKSRTAARTVLQKGSSAAIATSHESDSGSRGGMKANVAAMTANSWRQASIPEIPTAARAGDRLRTPWIAHTTNGSASCSSRKSFITSGQSRGVKGTSSGRRHRDPPRTRFGPHQGICRRNNPPEHDVLDDKQRSGVGKETVNRHECKPNRRQVVHLPDRRPFFGVPRQRADCHLAIAEGERPEPLIVIGQVPGPTASKLVVASERLIGRNRRHGYGDHGHDQPA